MPREAGYCGTDTAWLATALRELVADPDLARERGAAARRHALRRYGLQRFLTDWDRVLDRTVAEHHERRRRVVPTRPIGRR